MLSKSEIELFYKLWCDLIWSVNQKHKIVSGFKKPVYGVRIVEEPFIAIRSKLWENPQWIDEFLNEKESGELNELECSILKGWRKDFIKNRFIIAKHLPKYTVFMTFDEPSKLYGVCGISNPIKETAPYPAPCIVDAVLLPFKDKIIYDSFIGTYPVTFDKNLKNSIKESYEESKETIGIVEIMGVSPIPIKQQPVAKKPKTLPLATIVVDTKGADVPKSMSARYMAVADIIEKFCDEKLNNEYKEICLKALAKLCRKRPSPLMSGKAQTWACGIIYAIGASNFIFDKTQPLNMTASEIAEWFNLSKSTAHNKATEINKLLDLSYFNTEFQLKKLVDKNPMTWYVTVNGFIVDVRTMPRKIQEEAFHKGLIPYIPTDEKTDETI
ncbi:MAG: DUF6398 domain-containing protein [Candidatus Bathyarchaeota archaeon]|nr:DUF6398 domain-containing protein [Candidatus Termiticorpusculum sp.]